MPKHECNICKTTKYANRNLKLFNMNIKMITYYMNISANLILIRDAFQKKNYVDRETVPKECRGVAPFPYKNHS